MYPVRFPQQNIVYRKDGCKDLPACKRYNEQFKTDEVISCWELSDDEIMQILNEVKDGKRPRIFLAVVGGQPPVALFMESESDEHERSD